MKSNIMMNESERENDYVVRSIIQSFLSVSILCWQDEINKYIKTYTSFPPLPSRCSRAVTLHTRSINLPIYIILPLFSCRPPSSTASSPARQSPHSYSQSAATSWGLRQVAYVCSHIQSISYIAKQSKSMGKRCDQPGCGSTRRIQVKRVG